MLNPTCWAAGIDFSGVCAAQLTATVANGQVTGGYSCPFFPVTAISPWHVAMAAHVYGAGHVIGLPVQVQFLGNDGVVYTRTVTTSTLAYQDIQIGLLNAALPATVTPLPILPVDWLVRLSGPPAGLLALAFNQQRQMLIGSYDGTSSFGTAVTLDCAQGTPASLFSTPWISGDSSSPAFVLLGNQPFLLTTATSGGSGTLLGAGTSYPACLAQIVAAMATLGPAGVTLPTAFFPAPATVQWNSIQNVPPTILNPVQNVISSVTVGGSVGTPSLPLLYVQNAMARLALSVGVGQEVEEADKGVRFRLLRPFPSDPRAWSCLDLDAVLMDAVRDADDGSPMVDDHGQIVVDDVTPGWLSTVRDAADLSPVTDSTDGSVVTSY